jgi:hypothetical protein
MVSNSFTIPNELVRSWSVVYSDTRKDFSVSIRCAYDVRSIRGHSLAYLSGHASASALQLAIDLAIFDLQDKIAEENARLGKANEPIDFANLELDL